ncbi:unnamed protein product, partial [Vitis vinifera]|uniref:Uncharacterized protein n=1 Tax=Vitis vinifera TaxID=29760 RepID=D7U8C9_VITVI
MLVRFLYTGSVEIIFDIAQDLLIATDQYLLQGLSVPVSVPLPMIYHWKMFQECMSFQKPSMLFP